MHCHRQAVQTCRTIVQVIGVVTSVAPVTLQGAPDASSVAYQGAPLLHTPALPDLHCCAMYLAQSLTQPVCSGRHVGGATTPSMGWVSNGVGPFVAKGYKCCHPAHAWCCYRRQACASKVHACLTIGLLIQSIPCDKIHRWPSIGQASPYMRQGSMDCVAKAICNMFKVWCGCKQSQWCAC